MQILTRFQAEFQEKLFKSFTITCLFFKMYLKLKIYKINHLKTIQFGEHSLLLPTFKIEFLYPIHFTQYA
jgi:hypothetical protein